MHSAQGDAWQIVQGVHAHNVFTGCSHAPRKHAPQQNPCSNIARNACQQLKSRQVECICPFRLITLVPSRCACVSRNRILSGPHRRQERRSERPWARRAISVVGNTSQLPWPSQRTTPPTIRARRPTGTASRGPRSTSTQAGREWTPSSFATRGMPRSTMLSKLTSRAAAQGCHSSSVH